MSAGLMQQMISPTQVCAACTAVVIYVAFTQHHGFLAVTQLTYVY